ncbi:hypothetical protein [Rhodanobacter fulvus]|nr:hypothetical protein [Rhodanobacter fulvus]
MAESSRLAGARHLDGLDYPPEFAFDPDNGQALAAFTPSHAAPWVPPFGGDDDRTVRGLQCTTVALALADRGERDETSDPDSGLLSPSAGQYEFLVLPSASGSMELIALDPGQSMLKWWQPTSGQWALLEQLNAGLLAGSTLPPTAWRCEKAHDGDTTSRLFLPTSHGLACVQLDLLRLGYRVGYAGGGACCGAPIRWRNGIWAVLRSPSGQLHLQEADPSSGSAGQVVAVDGTVGEESFAAPTCVARQIIWPGVHGKLVLEVAADGSLSAEYRLWPAGIEPRFDFGSPYLSRDGQLWQTCWSEGDGSYAYLRLDGREVEPRLASAPRACTGQINYRLSMRMKLAPWDDPEHGSDANSRFLFVPLLESVVDAAAIGLRMETTDGLETVLLSQERQRAVLEIQSDRVAEQRLFVMNVPKPWTGRVFVHDHKLWFWHPELKQIVGWELVA